MHVHTERAEDTEAFGAQLARARPERDDSVAVVYLTGDLGAGKTTLTRGFLRAHGVQGPVRSPTYTLMEVYEMDTLTTVHLDLYRLRDPEELDNIGLREWAKPDHVWLIEWPERGAGRLPAPDVSVTLKAGTAGHNIEVTAHTVYGASWLGRLQAPGTK